jgi:hypothetical protein
MTGDSTHGIVGNARGQGTADPGRVGKERVEASVTSLEGLASQ